MDATQSALFPDLVIKFDILTTPTTFPEEKGSVQFGVTNQGDGVFTGPLDINLYASTDSVLNLAPSDPSYDPVTGKAELLGTLNIPTVTLEPGKSESFTVDFADSSSKFHTPSVVAPGSYYLLGQIDPDNTIAESNKANNVTSAHISAAGSDPVIEWNATTLNVIQKTGAFATAGARDLAIVHAAIYDAVNAIDQSHSAYSVEVNPSQSAGASPEAAADAAAYRTLINLFPAQKAIFDEQLSRSLAEIPDDLSKSKGIALGEYVADQTLALRSSDGFDQAQGPYTPGTQPGQWRPTPPNFLPAGFPEGGNVTPFVIPSVNDYVGSGFPELTSDTYTADFNVVKALGREDSVVRTKDQTEIAKFWSYDLLGNFGVTGFWNKIAEDVALKQGNTLADNARLFARLNFAEADASTAVLNSKYTNNIWRPITAIREADTDGNPDTIADSKWTPLLPTPNNPEYLAGHAIGGGAAAAVLTDFFGDNFSFTTSSEELPAVFRSYGSFSQASQEDALSRVYGGVHFPTSVIESQALGQNLGNYVVQHVLV